jgi:hypothetical protein
MRFTRGKSRWTPKLAVVAALLAAAAAWTNGAAAQQSAPAQAATTREQVERRVDSVGKLIEGSTGAQQIEASGGVEAKARRDKARELHRQAQDALRANDLAGASRLLDEASKSMFAGVRSAAPEQVTASKERRDYDARMASTRALLDAQKRIAAEKGLGGREQDLVRTIDGLLAESQARLAGGDVAAARKSLDQAYLLAKASVGGMRSGDTLVRSLDFASKADEYRYELDRNDTHRMLLDVVLRDKRPAVADGRLDTSLAEAARLRKAAEDVSARGDYEEGIRSLEQSTRELVKAIRSTGLYIPG